MQSLSCEAPFYTRGAQGNEGAQVLHRWAQGSDSRGQRLKKDSHRLGCGNMFIVSAPLGS